MSDECITAAHRWSRHPFPLHGLISGQRAFMHNHQARCLQDGEAATGPGSRFYALLVEVLKVEANVLFNDVLRPAADGGAAAGSSGDQERKPGSAVIAPDLADHASSIAGVFGGKAVDMQASAADSAGPSSSAAGKAPDGHSAAMDVDEAGPSQPAEAGAVGGEVTAGRGVFPQPFQQPWTPEQQAERWAAAERAAAAAVASGSAAQQVSVQCSRPRLHLP